MTGRSAASHGLAGCHDCGLVSRVSGHACACPRCGAALHLRKPDSLGRAWALVIASYILYVPANVLPIMETSSLFGAQRDTILSGVVFLWRSGSWDLALVVFVASVVVPLSKLFALGVLVSIVKLAHVATIVPGIALWSFGVLMVVLAAAVNSVDQRDIWARAEALR